MVGGCREPTRRDGLSLRDSSAVPRLRRLRTGRTELKLRPYTQSKPLEPPKRGRPIGTPSFASSERRLLRRDALFAIEQERRQGLDVLVRLLPLGPVTRVLDLVELGADEVGAVLTVVRPAP